MKAITIFIIVLLVISSVVVGYNYIDEKSKIIDFGGVKISSDNLLDLTNNLEEKEPFMICSIKDNKCAMSMKHNLG